MSDEIDEGRELIKNPQHRPTLYRPEYDQMLIDHMSDGLSFSTFAGVVSVSSQTIYDWCKKYPTFLDAKKIGMVKSKLYWEKLGKDNIINYSLTEKNGDYSKTESRSLNSSVWIFSMRNKYLWHDRQAEYPHLNAEADTEATEASEPSQSKVPSMTKEMALRLLEEKKGK